MMTPSEASELSRATMVVMTTRLHRPLAAVLSPAVPVIAGGFFAASMVLTAADPPVPAPPGYVIAFSDEFAGTRLDPKKWIDLYPDRWGRFHSNNEQQYYAPDGYEVKGGLLLLRAETRHLPEGRDRPYTSGMIASQPFFTQKFGWWEIRAKLPKGRGLWPAFWLLPADKTWPPEIDVMEFLGHEPTRVHMTFHRGPSRKLVSTSKDWTGPDFSADFHTFAVEWKPGALAWFVDGTERARYEGPDVPDCPMYVIANLAVGGNWPGMPDGTTPFPSVMEIDYIRVYRSAEGTQ
jgi:beta-glucanase (GH16 family)